MIIYNVTVKVDPDVAHSWVIWMQQEHIPDLLQLGLFTDARLCRLLEQPDDDGVTYVAQYFCESIGKYHQYIEEFSATMREKGRVAFGGKFTAFRTVMEIL